MSTEQMTTRTRNAQDEIDGQVVASIRMAEELDSVMRRIRTFASEVVDARNFDEADDYARRLAAHMQEAQEALQQINTRMFSITALAQEVSSLGVARFE